jgi:capsular exopolysaccharide synthesis family protein
MQRSNNRLVIDLESDPSSPVSEAYRTLRINIEFSSVGREMKTIAVTSAHPGEGKTTTVINLAVAYAQVGMKVLLIDADMRKPSIHKGLGMPNKIGLANILVRKGRMNSEITETAITNLSVITSGAETMNSSELLASNQFDLLLDELKQSYDVILIDTPPALSVMDAKIIAAKCDGVLLVVEYHKVKSDAARRLVEDLSSVKANLLGVVLNKINNKDEALYSYKYS